MKKNYFILSLSLLFAIFMISADKDDYNKGLYGLPQISQVDFNRIAAEVGIPLFWAGG